MKEEERVHKAKQELRTIGYTLLTTQHDKGRFVVAHLGSETVVNDPATLDELEALVLELKEEGWRRA